MKNNMLKAAEHNWGLMGPGDWRESVWEISYDRMYKVTNKFNPKMSPDSDEIPKLVVKTTTGKMGDDEFQKLQSLLDMEQWRTPGVRTDACDGVAWKIDYYSPEGEIKRSSGKLGYIYGEKVLEGIVALLPRSVSM